MNDTIDAQDQAHAPRPYHHGDLARVLAEAAEALVREYREETGLVVAPLDRLTEASQYFVRTDGEALNNVSAFWSMTITASEPDTKLEADHNLVWMTPQEALVAVRHEAHAWAISCWLRQIARQ